MQPITRRAGLPQDARAHPVSLWRAACRMSARASIRHMLGRQPPDGCQPCGVELGTLLGGTGRWTAVAMEAGLRHSCALLRRCLGFSAARRGVRPPALAAAARARAAHERGRGTRKRRLMAAAAAVPDGPQCAHAHVLWNGDHLPPGQPLARVHGPRVACRGLGARRACWSRVCESVDRSA